LHPADDTLDHFAAGRAPGGPEGGQVQPPAQGRFGNPRLGRGRGMGGFAEQSKNEGLLPAREFVQAAHFRSSPLTGRPERAVVTSASTAALMWSGRVGLGRRLGHGLARSQQQERLIVGKAPAFLEPF
jgi:hypothetical protein